MEKNEQKTSKKYHLLPGHGIFAYFCSVITR